MKKTVLILAANPKGTVPLRLDEEVREIKEGLQRSQRRDLFEVVYQTAARPRDVQRAMLDYRPHVVHFCGHGEGTAGLVLEDETNVAKLVSGEALAELFKLFADQLECVLLNACYSDVQAQAIAQHVGSVIGMTQAIGDKSAISFAVSFYDALGAGRTVEFAYNLGCSGMRLSGVAGDSIPVLYQKSTHSETNIAIMDSKSQREEEISANQKPAKIFISYKRGVNPDEPLALSLYEALRREHNVFIDQTMLVGTLWAERIEAEIRQSDFLITLLSKDSVSSEMVKGEIETAHHLAKQYGKPHILPVRLAYQEPFQYPLSAYLNGINWAFWQGPKDTERLILELEKAILGCDLSIDTVELKAEIIHASVPPEIPQPSPVAQLDQLKPSIFLEMPEGTMDPESKFYVERSSDEIALQTIQRQGVTITIKGPRQMGKSSLLIRTVERAIKAGKRVAFLDFQLFNKTALSYADQFFRQFCVWLTDELELEDRVEELWNSGLGNNQNCTRYVQRYLLKEINSPLVLAMDEVESIFDTDFRSDFFSMLRGWHNSRATTSIWKRLDLALVTSTEPYQLIENLNQSPFNVGQVIELNDFSLEQVTELNQRHGSPLDANQLKQLMVLLEGHPYLVRRALYLISSQQITSTNLFARAIEERGPFGDHLRYHLFRVHDKKDLIQGLLQVLRNNTCNDEKIFFRLRGAGLVRREGQTVLPRCQLYARYFGEHLRG